MPADVRQTYQQMMGIFADRNQNGIPDIMEGGSATANIVRANLSAPTTIIHDGKTYSNPNDLPPDARKKYDEAMAKLAESGSSDYANKDGVPDALAGAVQPTVIMGSAMNIMHDGKVYSSLNDLPPDARAKVEQAMGMGGDADHNGVSDILEGKPIVQVTTTSSSASKPTGDNSKNMMMVAVLFFLLAVVAVLVVLLLIK